MAFRSSPRFGFLVGFLFGTFGLWILAMLSLALPPVEIATSPLFVPGRLAASYLEHDGSMGTAGTLALFLGDGLLYGLIGAGIHALARRKA